MSEYTIEVKNLSKKFGKFTAVDNISFKVKQGEIFGFLGANGAGKSTTIRMLCGLLNSSAGTASVGGYDINTQPEKVKEQIGYMSQKFSLYEDLTVAENINFFGGIYGLSNNRLKQRMNWVLEMSGLQGRENSLTRELAGGWKQRLALGCAILHEPQIVFLDEPTGGVDPLSRRRFWELINALSQAGATVFVTTHYLDEAEYCGNLMLIHRGKLIAGGSPRELKSKYLQNPVLEMECENVVDALEILQKHSWIKDASLFGSYLHIGVEDEYEGKRLIERSLAENNIGIKRIDLISPSLEDVFLHLVEEAS